MLPVEPHPPAGDDPVYLLTGAAGSPVVFAGRASGLYRSGDGGHSWELAAMGGPVVAAAFLPGGAAVAGAPVGGIRSNDGGKTWQPITFPAPVPFLIALAAAQAAEGAVFVAATAEDGMLRSTDGGMRWSPWNFGLLDREMLCLAISPAFTVDRLALAGAGSGLFLSRNGGRAWSEAALPGGPASVLSAAIGYPFNPGEAAQPHLLAGTETGELYLSTSSGMQWAAVKLPASGALNMLAASPLPAHPGLAALIESDVWLFTPPQGWRQVPLAGGRATALYIPAWPAAALLVGLESGEVRRFPAWE